MLKAFFNYITRELVIAQLYHTTFDAHCYPVFVLLVSALL